MYTTYATRPSLTLGFHGCDLSVAEKVFSGEALLNPSTNNFDWLGHGIYFWENNPERALQFAKDHPSRSIEKPTVVGAVINLGYCLDLTDANSIQLVQKAHETLVDSLENVNLLPRNKGGRDNVVRELDCTVFEALHLFRREAKEQPFDSIKGIFIEGKPAYEGAGFFEKTHTQICILNPNCIKGYFRLLEDALDYAIV